MLGSICSIGISYGVFAEKVDGPLRDHILDPWPLDVLALSGLSNMSEMSNMDVLPVFIFLVPFRGGLGTPCAFTVGWDLCLVAGWLLVRMPLLTFWLRLSRFIWIFSYLPTLAVSSRFFRSSDLSLFFSMCF